MNMMMDGGRGDQHRKGRGPLLRLQERKMETMSPFLVHCVTHDRDGNHFVTWCGVGTPYEPYFISTEHAIKAHREGAMPVPCGFCMAKIEEALR